MRESHASEVCKMINLMKADSYGAPVLFLLYSFLFIYFLQGSLYKKEKKKEKINKSQYTKPFFSQTDFLSFKADNSGSTSHHGLPELLSAPLALKG